MTLVMELNKQRSEGRAEGESRFADLMVALFRDGRAKDAERAATDIAFRKALYHEYHMDDES